MELQSRLYVRKIVTVEEIHTLPLLKSLQPFRKENRVGLLFKRDVYKGKNRIAVFKRQLHGTLLIVMTGILSPRQSYNYFLKGVKS